MKSFNLLLSGLLIPVMLTAGNPQGVVPGNNKFAFRLYHAIAQGTGGNNRFCSPFSISTALAMVYAGARSETEIQMSRAMNFAIGERFHQDYKKLLSELDKGTSGKITLNIANGIWADNSVPFPGQFIDIVHTNYKSELKTVDFQNQEAREQSRNDINSWVKEKTSNKITGLLGKGDLTRFSRLVLVNAIYFYGNWETPFKASSTLPKTFFLAGGGEVTTPFMNQAGRYSYYEDSGVQALEIPYKDNEASMIIFLPVSRDGFEDFNKRFDYRYFSEITDSFQTTEVRLSLPKFKTGDKFELSSILSDMGMPLAFSGDSADFSGITGRRDLCISKVIHQALIEVDETGTEAAAATAVTMVCTASRIQPDIKIFRADHPFIFMIRENTTGSILFMGRIMNPAVSD